MRTIATLAGALAWAFLVFLIALHVHFPSDQALDRARYELQEASDGGWALDADGLSLWRLTGMQLDDATLYSVKTPRRKARRRGKDVEDDADSEVLEALKAKPFLSAERIRARLALFPLLTGTRQVNFDASVLGGDLDGSVGLSDQGRRIVLEGEDLDLSKLPIGGESWSVDATGRMQIDTDLSLSNEQPRQSTGEFHLSLEQFAIRSASAMGIELTPVAFTEAALDVNIANGKAEIARGVLDGDILDAEFSGYIALSKRSMDRWRMRVEIKLELSDTLDSLAQFSPDLKGAKDDSGVYHLACNGTLSRPLCAADRTAAGTIKKRTRPSLTTSSDDDEDKSQVRREVILDGDDEAEADADDERARRRERRLERIRERRERLRQERKARDQGEDLDEVLEEQGMPFGGNGDGPRPLPIPRDFRPELVDPAGEFIEPDFPPEDLPLDDPGFEPPGFEPPGFEDMPIDEGPEPY